MISSTKTLTIDPRGIIIPEERQRKDLKDRTALKESLTRVGRLINPIVVTCTKKEGNAYATYELVAGHRRLLSVLELDWPTVDAILWENLDENDKYLIELEENIGRADLEWHEEAAAVAKLQEYKKLSVEGTLDGKRGRGLAATNPNKENEAKERWTLSDTADLLGVTKSKVSLDIKLSTAIKDNPELKKLTKTQALASLKREEISRIRKELARRARSETLDCIIHGDCRTVLKTIADESIDLIITDPPYGVNVHEVLTDVTAIIKDEDKFDDSDDTWKVILEVRDDLHRVLVPGSHLYIFCAIENFRAIRDYYAEKFLVRRVPLVWSKVYGGKTQSPDFQWGNSWEPIIFCSKGTRAFNKNEALKPPRGDVLVYSRVQGTDKVHETEKPLHLIKDLIEVSSDPNELVLDPFAGSGSTGAAAIISGRKAILIEEKDYHITTIKSRLEEALEIERNRNGVERTEDSNGDSEDDEDSGA